MGRGEVVLSVTAILLPSWIHGKGFKWGEGIGGIVFLSMMFSVS